jgi:hypothetical protein
LASWHVRYDIKACFVAEWKPYRIINSILYFSSVGQRDFLTVMGIISSLLDLALCHSGLASVAKDGSTGHLPAMGWN